jgi:hypothetical protein
MIVHDHIGMDGHAKLGRVFLPQIEQLLSVQVINHDALAVGAALDHVVRITWDGQSGKAGHGKVINWGLTPIIVATLDGHVSFTASLEIGV